MIPAAITHLQESFFRTANADGDSLESTSTHPCHRLSIPAARLFWCRHCMQIFEDPITRWRHSKTCLQSSAGRVKKDKDGTTMQVFLSANNLSELREQSRAAAKGQGAGRTPSTELRCFICKTTFASIDEMRVHVRTPCRKRPKAAAAPKNKVPIAPAEVKTEIQIPNTASEIIYIKDGHQTVISLESSFATEVVETTIPLVETVVPVVSKVEEVSAQPDDQTENKENNIRKRKRILPKEINDRPHNKTNNSPKSDQQIALTKPNDTKDVPDDIEAPSVKISKMTNEDPEDETVQNKVRVRQLQTKEESRQLPTTENNDNQLSIGEEHLLNNIVAEQVVDGDNLLKPPVSPVEKVVTGAAAEARLKDLFTEMEMRSKSKLPPCPKQTKTVNSPKKSYQKRSPTKIRNSDINKSPNKDLVKSKSNVLKEAMDRSGLLLYMPPLNAGSVTLPDPLLGLRSGLPAEMLLDETTNTKLALPLSLEAINGIIPTDIRVEPKLPSHIFDGDLLPSQTHSDVLFEEPVDNKVVVEKLVPPGEVAQIVSPVGVDEVETELDRSVSEGQVSPVEEVVSPEVDTINRGNGQIFASIEEVPLHVTIDHVEEIAHIPSVEEIPVNTTVGPIEKIEPPVEEVTSEETASLILETTPIETVSSIEEATSVETVTQSEETPPIERLSSIEETLRIEKVTSVLEATKIDSAPLDPEITPVAAISLSQEPTSVETLTAVLEPTIAETAPSVQEPTPTKAVLPVIETLTTVIDTKSAEIDTAEKESKLVDVTSSLKAVEESLETSLEKPESLLVNDKEEALPDSESLEESKQEAEETKPAEKNAKTKTEDDDDDDEDEEDGVTEKAKAETKKSTKQFKCKACSNVFKTSQALQKHSRFPCILKHTRSLSQKILRPKQPCLKIEKKPLKKKLVRPSRRQNLMIPIMPITRAELLPTVQKKPKRLSRRKKRRSYFVDEQKRILPFVNVLMSELSDKDRFFYKLGMLNQCCKTPFSETTAPNIEPQVKILDDPAAQFSGLEIESTNLPPIDSLTSAEPQGIVYSPAVVAACDSEKENLPALAKGLCLPTLEMMEHSQFHDPNCISSGNLKLDSNNESREITGQSPCWDAAPRLAQLPGVTQIVRVTSTNPTSADLLNGIEKAFVAPETDQDNVVVNGKSHPLSNSNINCKKQSKRISKEMVNDSDSNSHRHQAAKNSALKSEEKEKLNSKEPFGNVSENGTSKQETWSRSLKKQPCSDATQKDHVDSAEKNMNKKLSSNSINKVNILKTKDRKRGGVKSRKLLRKGRLNPSAKTNLTRSSLNKNSLKSKLERSKRTKHKVSKSDNPTKNHDRSKDRNQKMTPNGANTEKKPRSVDSSVSNPQRKVSNTPSKNNTSLTSKKVKANQNSESPSPSRKVTSNQKSSMTTPTSSKKISSNQKPSLNTPTSSKKGVSNQKSPMTTPTSSKKAPPKLKSSLSTPTSSKKVSSNQKSPIVTPTSTKKSSNQKSSMNTPTPSKKSSSDQKSPMTTPSSKKVASSQKSSMTTPTSSKKRDSSKDSFTTTPTSKKIASNQKSPMTTPSSSKKVASNQKSLMTSPTSSKKGDSGKDTLALTPSSKKIASNPKSPMTTATSSKKVASNQKSSITTPTSLKKRDSSRDSLTTTPTSSKKVASNPKFTLTTPASSKNMVTNQKSSKQQSVSSKKLLQLQQRSRRRDEKKLRALRMKYTSKTISTRSSPLKKAICNQALELIKKQKSIVSVLKKKATSSRRQKDRICKPSRRSLRGKPMSKSLQLKERNSPRINGISQQNSKKIIPNGVNQAKNRQVPLSKSDSSEILYSLVEKSPAPSKASSMLRELKAVSKDTKKGKPINETCEPGSPSRMTRSTQKIDDSIVNSKDAQKAVQSSTKRNSKSLPESKHSNSPRKNELTRPIKNLSDPGERNSSPGRRVNKKLELSENKSQISRTNLASPTSETKHRKNKSLIEKSGSPSKSSSMNNHSNSAPIPNCRNRSISKSDAESDSAENDTALSSDKLISKPLANTAYSTSSRPKSKICSESIPNPVSIDNETVSNENISSSSTYQNTEFDLLAKIGSMSLSKCDGEECDEINQKESLNTCRDSKDSQTSSRISGSDKSQVAGIPAGSCRKQGSRELGNKHSVKMIESQKKSVVLNEKLKENVKNSPRSGEMDSINPATELLSRESLLKLGSSDPHETAVPTVVTVTNSAVTTATNCVNKGDLTISSPIENKTPSKNSEALLNVPTTATSSPRVSISTQTDSSFVKETKAVPSDSCDNVEKTELPLSLTSSILDPTPPVPLSSTTNTTPTSVDNIPSSTVLSEEEKCEELIQDNIHLDPNGLHLPQEIVINETPLPQCEPIQGDSGPQEESTEANILLQQQSIPDPSSGIDTVSVPVQQLVLDNGTDPNLLMQYLGGLDPSLLQQGVTYVIIQGAPGEALPLTEDHNLIIEQPAFSEHAEANSSVIYTLQIPAPQSDINTEAECIMTDSS